MTLSEVDDSDSPRENWPVIPKRPPNDSPAIPPAPFSLFVLAFLLLDTSTRTPIDQWFEIGGTWAAGTRKPTASVKFSQLSF